jgi:dihydroorotate dehydrogenase electron transfer subunit
MQLVRAMVLANDVIMPDTHVLSLESGELGLAASPGQFVHIRTSRSWEMLLRRPMSIYRILPDGVSLMVRAVGSGSAVIATSRPGDELDCLGPLGRPFSVTPTSKRLLMVGGGYGAAPLLALADRAMPAGCEVVLLVGAASAEYVFPPALVSPEIEYQAATMDGSMGHHGYVTELIPRYLEWADAVYACGPTPMLEAVSRVCRPAAVGVAGSVDYAKPIQLAMEQHMGCAMGVCLGCVVKTNHGYQRVCRDGPVFNAEELVWERSA